MAAIAPYSNRLLPPNISMGLSVDFVHSDASHYISFVCKICNDVADMDAMITNQCCSHAFCKNCTSSWRSDQCPGCSKSFQVNSLQEDQPLAHVCLGKIQVKCPGCESWRGDYSQLSDHEETCSCCESAQPQHSSKTRSVSPSQDRRGSINSRRRPHSIRGKSGSPGLCSSGRFRGSEKFKIDQLEMPIDNDAKNTGSPTERQIYNNRKMRARSRSPSRGTAARQSIRTTRSAPDNAEIPQSSRDGRSRNGRRGLVDQSTPSSERRGSIGISTTRSSSVSFRGRRDSCSKSIANALLLKEEGNTKFNRGAHKEARELYTKALNSVQDFQLTLPQEKQTIATLYCNRGATFLKEKDYNECIYDCDEALELMPEYTKAYTRKWRSLMGLGRIDDAVDFLAQAIHFLPEENSFKEELERTRELDDKIQDVKHLLRNRKYSEAKEKADSLLSLVETPDALLLVASCDAAHGIIDPSLLKVDTVLNKIDPKSAKALMTKGYVKLLDGDPDSGALYVKEATKYDPENKEFKDLLRLCRKMQHDLSEARSCVSKHRMDNSTSVLKKALGYFTAAIDSDEIPNKTPFQAKLRAERAAVGLKLKKYQGALTDVQTALEISPKHAPAWVVKSKALIGLGRAREARDELKKIKNTWGKSDSEIKHAYSKADFEVRIQEQDKELRAMIAESKKRFGKGDASDERTVGRRKSFASSGSSQGPRKSCAGGGSNTGPRSRRTSSKVRTSHSRGDTGRSQSSTPKNMKKRSQSTYVPRSGPGEKPGQSNSTRRRPSRPKGDTTRRQSLDH